MASPGHAHVGRAQVLRRIGGGIGIGYAYVMADQFTAYVLAAAEQLTALEVLERDGHVGGACAGVGAGRAVQPRGYVHSQHPRAAFGYQRHKAAHAQVHAAQRAAQLGAEQRVHAQLRAQHRGAAQPGQILNKRLTVLGVAELCAG